MLLKWIGCEPLPRDRFTLRTSSPLEKVDRMKPPLKIKFTDYYRGWDSQRNLFSELLAEMYELSYSDQPDILFFLPFGTDHLHYPCRKVFITGENIRPDFGVCDYAFSFDYLDDPRNYRFPLALWGNIQVPAEWNPEKALRNKDRFCNFVYSNPSCRLRNELFDKLSRYKMVDSGGRYKNNLGHRIDDKHAFLRQYKFTIAYENSSHPGYVTEKIADAFAADSLPIYWGNPEVGRDFNPASFINYHDLGSNDAVIEKIIELDQNDDAYLEVIRQPRYPEDSFPDFARPERIRERLRQIVESSASPRRVTGRDRFAHRARYARTKWTRRLQRWRGRLWG